MCYNSKILNNCRLFIVIAATVSAATLFAVCPAQAADKEPNVGQSSCAAGRASPMTGRIPRFDCEPRGLSPISGGAREFTSG